MALDAAAVGLHRGHLVAAEQAAAAGEMAERVDVRADVRAERDRVGGGAVADRADELAVLLYQAVQERRMRGMVRHADEVGLGEVIDLRAGERVEERRHAGGFPSLGGAATNR